MATTAAAQSNKVCEILQEKRFTIGGISVAQTVNASAFADRLLITTVFSFANGDDYEHIAHSSSLPQDEAESLLNEEWRLNLARKHMADLVRRQRGAADLLDAAMGGR